MKYALVTNKNKMSDSESDDAEEYSDADQADQQFSSDKRAHHNALERKRRVHIKDSFHMLRDSIPGAFAERASRATILNKATEYIELMKSKNTTHQQDIEVLKEENQLLEQQIRALENAVSVDQTGPGPSEELVQGVSSAGSRSASDIESGDVQTSSRSSGSSRRKKKLKPLPVDDV